MCSNYFLFASKLIAHFFMFSLKIRGWLHAFNVFFTVVICSHVYIKENYNNVVHHIELTHLYYFPLITLNYDPSICLSLAAALCLLNVAVFTRSKWTNMICFSPLLLINLDDCLNLFLVLVSWFLFSYKR